MNATLQKSAVESQISFKTISCRKPIIVCRDSARHLYIINKICYTLLSFAMLLESVICLLFISFIYFKTLRVMAATPLVNKLNKVHGRTHHMYTF